MKFLLPFLALALLGATAASAERVQTGFVEGFDGSADGYAIERGTESIRVSVLTPVEVGDQIRVHEDDGAIRLMLGGTRSTLIQHAQDGFVVRGGERGATVLGNLADWLFAWAVPSNAPGSNMRVSLTTRGLQELESQLCDPEVIQQIRAGRDTMRVAWSGGVLPIRVELWEGETLRSLTTSFDAARALLAFPRAQVSGPREIRIVDASGQQISWQVAEVAAGVQRPLALESNGLPPVERIMGALERLAEGGAAARLEAYQEFSEMSGSYPPAAVLLDALEAGRSPNRPPPWANGEERSLNRETSPRP